MDYVNIPYDLVVVGAGINGLGVARDAALRGLRYFGHRDFALVRESLRGGSDFALSGGSVAGNERCVDDLVARHVERVVEILDPTGLAEAVDANRE